MLQALEASLKGLNRDAEPVVVEMGRTVKGVNIEMTRGLALARQASPWWVRPRVVAGASAVPSETLLLVWPLVGGGYGAMLPLASGKKRACLEGDAAGLSVVVQGPEDDDTPEPLVVVGGGASVYDLTHALMATAAQRLGTLALREDKATPDWVGLLGWCTWDAFYHDVSEQGVMDGLRELAANGVRPGFVMLDDGWLSLDGYRLTAFSPDLAKFPSGLSGLANKARQDFGVKHFGVWHALQGYWGGVHPDSELGKAYRIVDGVDTHWRGANRREQYGEERSLVHPDDIGRFFDDWHRYLAQQGVDMIKVDNQASLETFGGHEAETGINATATARAYQQGLQRSAVKHLGGRLLHCMCHDNRHALMLGQTNAWRNSDDFFPKIAPSHGRHLEENAKAALWSDPIAVADWDMFQSTHPAGQTHAVARSISGGPVYLSDKPGQHDAVLIHRLITSDSRVLRCNRGGAVITEDRLYVECTQEAKLLKMCNAHHVGQETLGVLGLFHCQWVGPDEDDAVNTAGPITDTWSRGDVPWLGGGEHVVWDVANQRVLRGEAAASGQVTLAPLGWSLLHLLPAEGGFAPVGLIEKFNAPAAICEIDRQAKRFKVIDGGAVGVWCEKPPAVVQVNGQDAAFDYDTDSGLLTVQVPVGGPATVSLAM